MVQAVVLSGRLVKHGGRRKEINLPSKRIFSFFFQRKATTTTTTKSTNFSQKPLSLIVGYDTVCLFKSTCR